MIKKIIAGEKGFIVIYMTVLVLALIFSFSTSMFVLTYGRQKISQNSIRSAQAYYSAESGLEDAVYRLKKSMNLPSNYSILPNIQISVQSPNANTKIITASADKANASKKLEAKITIETVNPQFFYGAQAGILGIDMRNNARIEGASGVSGNVYSNGPVRGRQNSVISGNVFVATGMGEDQNFSIYNSDQIFGKADPIIDMAQSFVPSVSNTLPKISLYIKRVGWPDSQTVRILADNAGSPSETVLASGTLIEDLVGTSYGWVDVVFPTPPSLSQGTTYWIMVDARRSSSNYWVWGKDQNSGYVLGQAKYSEDWDDDPWAGVTGDLNFKTYMGGQVTYLDSVIVKGDVHANTITESDICGDAFYQFIDSDSLNFVNNPSGPTCPDPLTPGAANLGSVDPPLQNMPISDSNINQWKQEAADGGEYNGNLSISSDMSYGPKKINGNLTMTSHNKTLTLTGTVYVTGNIQIENGSRIKCGPSYGLLSCILIADGWVRIENNGIFQGSGEPGSYIMILSASPCDGSTEIGCTEDKAAIELYNGATGAIFYANDGMIFLHNGVEVSEVTAKKIQLKEGAVISYEQGLANTGFSSGPGGSWQVDSWKEVE